MKSLIAGTAIAALMSSSVAYAGNLADAVVETIVDRADGVPLYLEEITKAAVEGARGDVGVPDTLQSSLMSHSALTRPPW